MYRTEAQGFNLVIFIFSVNLPFGCVIVDEVNFHDCIPFLSFCVWLNTLQRTSFSQLSAIVNK